MLRKYIAGFCLLLLCLGLVVADEAKGKFDDVQKGNRKEGTLVLVLKVDGKTQEFWCLFTAPLPMKAKPR